LGTERKAFEFFVETKALLGLFCLGKKCNYKLEMQKRTRIVGASVLLVLGGLLIAMNTLGGDGLHAAAVAESGFDWVKYLVWGGIASLFLSALLFISASAE
jgi:hypothetical protein